MNTLIRILFMGIAVATLFYSCGKEAWIIKRVF